MICKHRRYLMYISQNYSYAILRPIQKYILSQGGEVCWFLEGDEVDSSYLLTQETKLKTVKEVVDWKPDAVFVPGNTVPRFIPGVKVAVFHGFDSGKRSSKRGHFNIRGCFDLYCTQGPATTKPFQYLATKYGYFDVVETGWPTLDPLFEDNASNPYVDDNDKRPVILMCSTFSQSLSCAPTLFNKVKELSEKGRWRWLVQFHPKMPLEIVEKYKSLQNDNLQFIETDNVLPLLQTADVMLCDTSSVLIMFLLLGKPVVSFRNQSPSSYLIDVVDPSKIEGSIEKALTKPLEIESAINDYSKQVHPYQDGKSSARVVVATNELIENGLTNKRRKPLNLIRNFKLRKALKYWGC
ncbi:CDP-glycerol glycerophosphotransferase family protein [Vibrio breoganii]|uniref:CDP-glycerol glycerophosphotransferase family protein n=2 Tax=Vibrio breoganii TaxID=553239 RepID=UPI001F5383E2|nr:CDP-glycerol glycerophosphotransferase family protein [Vibrio breoganii]